MVRAVRLGSARGLDALEIAEVEAVPPGPGEIRVRIRAASLNFRDRLVVDGVFPAPDGLIPLSDAAGEVVEVGEGVTDLCAGDIVVSLFHPNWHDGHIDRPELNQVPGGPKPGFAATEVTRPASHFTAAPIGLSFAEAACLPCAAVTAWRALVTDGQMKPGANVLVLGSGGVSVFALQFAKAAGAMVIATGSSPEKCARLKAFGADNVINYREVEAWGAKVFELTGGVGVDHVVEVGGPRTLPQSLAAMRTGGHVAIIGAVGGFDIDTIPFAIVQAKRLRLQGVTVGSRRDQIEMIRAIERTGIRPVVGHSFALDGLANAFRMLAGLGRFGKVCIEI